MHCFVGFFTLLRSVSCNALLIGSRCNTYNIYIYIYISVHPSLLPCVGMWWLPTQLRACLGKASLLPDEESGGGGDYGYAVAKNKGSKMEEAVTSSSQQTTDTQAVKLSWWPRRFSRQFF